MELLLHENIHIKLSIPYLNIDLGLWCLTPLSTIFQLYSWPSVLLVEETGENHRSTASHCQTLSHNVVSPLWDSNSQC